MSSIVDGIARLIHDAGVGVYSPDTALPATGVPITVAAMPPTSGPAIAVTTYSGGPEPDTRNAWEYPRLQVRVRHDTPLGALDLERAVFGVLQATPGAYPVTTTGPTAWHLQDCTALQSEPQPLGVDDNGRHEFVRNYQLTCWPA